MVFPSRVWGLVVQWRWKKSPQGVRADLAPKAGIWVMPSQQWGLGGNRDRCEFSAHRLCQEDPSCHSSMSYPLPPSPQCHPLLTPSPLAACFPRSPLPSPAVDILTTSASFAMGWLCVRPPTRRAAGCVWPSQQPPEIPAEAFLAHVRGLQALA